MNIETPKTKRAAAKKLFGELQKLCNEKIKAFEKEWGVKASAQLKVDITDKKGELADEFIETSGIKVAVRNKNGECEIISAEKAKKNYPNELVEVLPRKVFEHDFVCEHCGATEHIAEHDFIPPVFYGALSHKCKKCGHNSYDIYLNRSETITAKYLYIPNPNNLPR